MEMIGHQNIGVQGAALGLQHRFKSAEEAPPVVIRKEYRLAVITAL
jgi:hypothetical protein